MPEGSVVPVKNGLPRPRSQSAGGPFGADATDGGAAPVLFTIENTDPECFWLTNYLETLLVQVWYPITVCTGSREQKRLIGRYLNETADSIEGVFFKLHDFGFRGVSSCESAALGGLAHLVNFRGTDTLVSLLAGREYYHCDMAGFSIPASEHSTITSWGREHEVDAFRNMLLSYPSNGVACVSDSYDVWQACDKLWGQELHDLVVERDQRHGVLVIRPDSGDPPEVVHRVLDILGAHGSAVAERPCWSAGADSPAARTFGCRQAIASATQSTQRATRYCRRMCVSSRATRSTTP